MSLIDFKFYVYTLFRPFAIEFVLEFHMANLTKEDLVGVASWAEAQAMSKGYEDEALVTDFLEQFIHDLPQRVMENRLCAPVTQEFSLRRLHLILGFLTAIQQKNDVCIADIGGGNGYMFDWITQSQPKYSLDWTVYESSAVARNYMEFGKSLGINFSDLTNFNEERKFDLTVISCALQYLENWEEVLTTAGRNSENILIMRAPLVRSSEHRFFIQKNNVGLYGKSQSSWPFIMFSRDLFEQKLASLGEIVIFASDSEETFPFAGELIPMSTILVKCN
jgi:putative methyltransferase (TIGR04325 family)